MDNFTLSADLVISDITYSKYGGISIGDPVKVIVTVENQGNADALTNLTVLVKTSNREYIISREPITVEINSKSVLRLIGRLMKQVFSGLRFVER